MSYEFKEPVIKEIHDFLDSITERDTTSVKMLCMTLDVRIERDWQLRRELISKLQGEISDAI